jgi:protein involved in polysaccharide export with SLBB domain
MLQSLFRSTLCAVVALSLLVSCGRSRPAAISLPDPRPSTTVGPGDVFEVSVLGEKDLVKEYRVQPDGSVDFPYLDRVVVRDLEPQQIEERIKSELVERKILTNPQVTLVVKQYNSKKVSVIGAVQKPGSLPWTEGMKLIDAISLAGGLTQLANGDHVRLTRIVSGTQTATVTVSVDDISEGRMADLLLQAGDTIKVDQRLF